MSSEIPDAIVLRRMLAQGGEGLAEARGLRMRGVAPLRKRHGYSIAVDPTQKMLASD